MTQTSTEGTRLCRDIYFKEQIFFNRDTSTGAEKANLKTFPIKINNYLSSFQGKIKIQKFLLLFFFRFKQSHHSK